MRRQLLQVSHYIRSGILRDRCLHYQIFDASSSCSSTIHIPSSIFFIHLSIMLSRPYQGEYDFAVLYEQLLNIQSFYETSAVHQNGSPPPHAKPRPKKRSKMPKVVPLVLDDVLGEFNMELERTLFARVSAIRDWSRH